MMLYGISNCDTVRKARQFLENQKLDFQFHDFRKNGLTTDMLQHWLQFVDYAELVNKRSKTWKSLTDSQRQAIENQDLTLLTHYPSLIKRPVLVEDHRILIGFKAEIYQVWL